MNTTIAPIRRLHGDEDAQVFDQLAEVHRAEISEGFLSTLGPSFLRTLYQTLASSKSAFVLVSIEGNRVQGFIVGAMDTGAVYKEFFNRAGFKALRFLLPKLFSVARIKRICETLFYPKKKQSDSLPEPEILNFCVRSDLQSKGVGTQLFLSLCDEFRQRGVSQIRIVTGESQLSAQKFYEKKNARLAANIQVHKDSQSRVYVYDIEPDQQVS